MYNYFQNLGDLYSVKFRGPPLIVAGTNIHKRERSVTSNKGLKMAADIKAQGFFECSTLTMVKYMYSKNIKCGHLIIAIIIVTFEQFGFTVQRRAKTVQKEWQTAQILINDTQLRSLSWSDYSLRNKSHNLSRGVGKRQMNHGIRNLFMPYANNKGADQPAHPHSVISNFVVHCLDSMVHLVSILSITWL